MFLLVMLKVVVFFKFVLIVIKCLVMCFWVCVVCKNYLIVDLVLVMVFDVVNVLDEIINNVVLVFKFCKIDVIWILLIFDM